MKDVKTFTYLFERC